QPRPPQKGRRLGPEPPRIDVPGPWTAKKRKPLDVEAKALPEGARAQLPAYDGDAFFITLPVRQRERASAQEVMDEVVLPVLKALRFERGPKALRQPSGEGVKQPVANFRGLANVVADEYARTPRLLRPQTKRMLDIFLGRAQPTPEIDKVIETG